MAKAKIAFQRFDEKGKLVYEKTFSSTEELIEYCKHLKGDDFIEEHPDGCWNCMNFDWKHEACTIRWNNMDEDYYNPDIDDRNLTDYCEQHETDPDADPECLEFGGNEP